MKKIEENQDNLAGTKMKAKKEWKKPEMIVINIKNTNQTPPYSGNDAFSQAQGS